MPRDPRSWTANLSMARRTAGSPCAGSVVRASLQLLTGGSRCQLKPSQRRTPNFPTTRTEPAGCRWTIVASSTYASTAMSRSEPAGRSKTISSFGPSVRRRIQLERPSAKRRAAGRGCSTERGAGDVELGLRRPDGWIRCGLEDRAAARGPSLVDRRPERQIDLLDQHVSDRGGFVQTQPALLELLGESPSVAPPQARPSVPNITRSQLHARKAMGQKRSRQLTSGQSGSWECGLALRG